jgi:peptidyl-tRNA hydrolase, PTH1 family
MAWVIVGLGNPGNEYENTRHNAGRMALMHFAKKNGLREWKVDEKNQLTVSKGALSKNLFVLLLPDTFMNNSGKAVLKYVKSPKMAEKLLVVYDDLDLPLGKLKLSWDRGSGGHKGLDSIMRSVKTRKFARIRIGVSPETAGGTLKKPNGEKEVNKFILDKFKSSELEDLKKIFKRTSEAIEAVLERGALVAMNEVNRN